MISSAANVQIAPPKLWPIIHTGAVGYLTTRDFTEDLTRGFSDSYANSKPLCT